jgi:hypothetical protein
VKIVQGITFYRPADYVSRREAKVEALTQKYLKFFLVAAFTVLVIAYIGMVRDIVHTFQFWQFLQAR